MKILLANKELHNALEVQKHDLGHIMPEQSIHHLKMHITWSDSITALHVDCIYNRQ